jgi:large subunit ribosomal protein L21
VSETALKKQQFRRVQQAPVQFLDNVNIMRVLERVIHVLRRASPLQRASTWSASRALAMKAPDTVSGDAQAPRKSILYNELTKPLGFSYYTIKRQVAGMNENALPAIFARHPPGATASTSTPAKRDPLIDGRGEGCFAVIAHGPKQYKVTVGDIVYLARIRGQVSEEVRFSTVLALGSVDWSVLGRPQVPGAEVIAVIEEQSLSQKIYIYQKKRRKGHERLLGHRQPYTRVWIKDIRWEVPDDTELEPLELALSP